MLGTSLLSFLVLTFIGAAVAVAYHKPMRHRFLEGNDVLFGKLIVGWLGARRYPYGEAKNFVRIV